MIIYRQKDIIKKFKKGYYKNLFEPGIFEQFYGTFNNSIIIALYVVFENANYVLKLYHFQTSILTTQRNA
jgi:hypothetical protein